MPGRLPLNAREQLLRAEELGHELKVETRGPWPERGDPHPKYYLSCSCGWKPVGHSRHKRAVNARMAWHLGDVLSRPGVSPSKRGA